MRERERERERERGFEDNSRKQEFSIFVLNLPRLLDRYGLFGIFKKAGTISDTYIPESNIRKNRRRFGFVRFTNAEDARRSIKLFHRAKVRGHTLIVTTARPKKRKQQGILRTQRWASNKKETQKLQGKVRKLEWRPKKKEEANKGKVDAFIDEDQDAELYISGKVSTENEDWLGRSLVCKVEEPRDLATLSSAILYDYDADVRVSALSSHKFLLSFPSVERMEIAWKQPEALSQWFSEIKKWGIEDGCDSRRVWLSIVGVPPHGWSWENFKMIAELWGKFISLGKSASSKDSFEAMTVCIATDIFRRISSEIILSLGSCGYRVFITEMNVIMQVHNVNNSTRNPNEKEDIPGFEDVADSSVGDDDNHNNDLQGQAELEDEEVLSNSNSKRRQVQQSGRNNDSSIWSPSKTRTKTASFSHNGYSEEMRKIRHHLNAKAAQEFNEEASTDSQPPPGFEFTTQKNKPCNHTAEKNPTQDTIVEESGCQTQNTERVKNKVQDQVITASKGNSKEAKTLQQAPTASDSSDSTSESLKQLAHESLKVGEILGVKVIGSYEAALSRITKPLKKARGQKKCLNNQDSQEQ